jgi:tetratricopeptide (TPR) repeat protein
MISRNTRSFVCAALVIALSAICANLAAEDDLASARGLLLAGKYARAEKAYTSLVEKQPVEAALGVARCRAAVGGYAEAEAALRKAVEANDESAPLLAELAHLAFGRGDYEKAQSRTEAALKLDANNLLARWTAAELLRVTGKLKQAGKAYEWFVDYYNDQDEIKSADDLRLVGLGAAQFARWTRANDQFGFLVNDLYPDALKLEKNFWPAHLDAGLLFLEKYNQADAAKEFQKALLLNPNAAEVHAAVAQLKLIGYDLAAAKTSIERALELNPNLLHARQLSADIHFSNFEPHKAVPVLEEALKLNPQSGETLGRLAAARGAVEGIRNDPAGTAMGQIIDAVNIRNPHAGAFYAALADTLDLLRKYPQSAQYYEETIRRMPQLTGIRGRLGMVQMRLGQEDAARKLLGESFDVDPFNVRVSNSLKVLEVLEDYETLETEHFLIRFDPKHDKIMARYAARYLEEIYPQLCQQLGYEPKEKSLFELFNKARNTSAHGWFSARMVGLPHIHTIGACAGKMVAMVSPTAMKQKFNWAQVLKHEFVHVINLQQTNFNIPHWYTEALAVLNEGQPRSQEWNEMLARRVPTGEVFDLESINQGFIRPHSSEDWQMAYCQAEMYAEYMLERFGEKSLAKMLKGYADNLTTREAIKRSFEVDQAEFEKGYREFVNKIVLGIAKAGSKPTPMTFAELDKAVRAKPDDPELAARLALAYLRRKSGPKARKLADKVLAAKPKHQLATYVKARLFLSIGENDAAVKMLEECFDEKAPQENVLSLLAALAFRGKDYDEAARMYSLGEKHFSGDKKWTKALASVYLKSGDKVKLIGVLTKLAEADSDEVAIRKKLAQLALAAEDFQAAARWANQAIHVDVLDVTLHRTLAEALVGLDKPAAAVAEWETVVELAPQQIESRVKLAAACMAAGQKEKARSVLDVLLKLDAENEAAKKLRETLNQ